MKVLSHRFTFFHGRMKSFGSVADWQGKFQAAGSASSQSFERIKTLGLTTDMDDYEKRKLKIFNQLNFFQLVTGFFIPIAGAVSNRHFPLVAWFVACTPALVNAIVLALNARRQYDLAKIAYFILYPFTTSVVYIWGINMGVELSFVLNGILAVFFIRDISQMLFALGMSMVSYFVLAGLCKNYPYQLASASLFFYVFNQLVTIAFIFYGLFLIKRENAGYQQSILQQKEEIYANGILLKKQTEELTQLNAFKNRLFSIIAHDLKSPIYALRNLFRNMQQFDLPAGEIKAMVPEVENELSHTTNLMENVLHWARSQMQADTVKPQLIDISGMMTDVIRLLRLQADAKSIRVTLQADVTAIAYADKDMTHLVLRNLLSNAIKYTPENGEITVGNTRTEKGIAVFVRDTGMGISPDALQKIQESNFYTTKGTAGEAGTGLGLMLCKEFIARNAGSLHIESLPGKGSTFTVILLSDDQPTPLSQA
ncbi:MAG TPA: HAMP domain-containing sensor histidine kinase [Puia sp.]|nr:HAMP domain-containing sensor histidine kinase [Puia sp.]